MIAIRIAIGYALAGFLTFGVAFNLDYTEEIRGTEGSNAARSLLCGATWPLYAAVKAFKFLRPEAPQ